MTPYPNPLITFVPPAVEITNITNSNPAIITTAVPHGYSPGLYVTVVIPYPNVMEQINGNTYFCVPLNATQLVLIVELLPGTSPTIIPLDTTHFSPWSTGPTVRVIELDPPNPPIITNVPAQVAQLVPSGEIATTLANVSNVIGPNNPTG